MIPPLPSWGQALGLDVALPQHQASLLRSSSWESPPFPATVKLSVDIKQTRGVEHIWTRISSESEGNGASEGGVGGVGGVLAGQAPASSRPAAVHQGLHVPSPPCGSENRGSPGGSLPTPTLVSHPPAACIQNLLNELSATGKVYPPFPHPPTVPSASPSWGSSPHPKPQGLGPGTQALAGVGGQGLGRARDEGSRAKVSRT